MLRFDRVPDRVPMDLHCVGVTPSGTRKPMGGSYIVYILRSEKDGKFYIGTTSELKRRLEDHEKGRVASTRRRRPLTLLRSEVYETRREAAKRERYLKSEHGHRFLQVVLEAKTAGRRR